MSSPPPLVRPATWAESPAPPRAPLWKYVVNVALAVAAMVLIAAIVARVVPLVLHRPPRRSHVPVLALIGEFLVLLLLFPPVVLAHELGHALAGTLAGWRLQSLFVGPWRFIRDDRPRVVLHRSFFYYGGAAVVVPSGWGTDERIRRSFRAMVAGGPLASVVVSVALFAALHFTSSSGRGPTSGWHFYLFVAATMSLAIGIGTLVPIRQTSTVRNDGLQLLLSRPRDRNGPRPLDPVIRLGALVLMLTERRPRDWTPEMLGVLAASPPHQRRTFEYYHALDAGDIDRARDMLQATLERVATAEGAAGARARQETAVESALFEAAWRADATAAREWLEIGAAAQRWDPHAVGLARAAIHAVEGDHAAARAELHRAARAAEQRIVARLDLLRAPFIDRIRELDTARALAAQP